MALSLLSIALLSTSALAAPRPEVEVVQVRQVSKRQDQSSLDLGDLLPSSIDLGDLSSLIPTDLGDLNTLLPTSLDLGDFSTLLPSAFESFDLGSFSVPDLATILPSGCLPPSDLAPVPTPAPEVISAIATWTDYCEEPSLTGEAGAQYSSYQDALSSWAEENGPEISSYVDSFLTNCPLASEFTSLIPTDSAGLNNLLGSYSIPTCGSSTRSRGSATARPTGSTTTGGPTQGSATEGGEEPTGAGAAASDASGTPGAAPQQTAFAAAAGVVAGIAGIVAVL